jgi:hypothetical protein
MDIESTEDTKSINSINNCPVCLIDLNNDTIKTLECNHAFHEKCISIWLDSNPTCPICRKINVINKDECEINIPIINYQNLIIARQPIYNINQRVIINNTRRRNCTEDTLNKIKKYISFILFILCVFFHLGSTVYNIVMFYKTNNNINDYIKTLNNTQLGNHSHTTYSTDVLASCNFFYYMFFIIINCIFFKICKCSTNNSRQFGNFCTCVTLGILVITNFLIHDAFMRNTNEYLNEEQFDFEKSYEVDLDMSHVLYLISFSCKIFMMIISCIYRID